MLLGATIAVSACTEESALPTGRTSDNGTADVVQSNTSTNDPRFLNALMVSGGCRDANGSDGALTVVLAPPRGRATRYDCTTIGLDSMFTLANNYRSFAARLPVGIAAALTSTDGGGYWGSGGKWREFCWVNLYTGQIHYCNIWYFFEYPVWIEGTGGDIPPDDPGSGGSGGPGSSGTTTGVEYFTPNPEPIEDEAALDGCHILLTPKCHAPLTADDILNLNASYQYLRDTLGVWADTVAQRECLELFRGLELLRTRPEPYGVYRGIDSLAVYIPKTDKWTEVHDAQAGQGNGRLHFDPPILAKATSVIGRKNLLATALHETAHALRYADHVDITATGDTVSSTDYDRFEYFKYTSVFGPNSCVVS